MTTPGKNQGNKRTPSRENRGSSDEGMDERAGVKNPGTDSELDDDLGDNDDEERVPESIEDQETGRGTRTDERGRGAERGE